MHFVHFGRVEKFAYISSECFLLSIAKVSNMIILIGIILIAFFWVFLTPLTNRKTETINGIYTTEGPLYYLKFLIFSALLTLQNVAKSRKKNAKVDQKSWDQPQEFPEDNPLGNDSIFFIGSCMKSGLTFIVATERRPDCLTYGLLYIYVKYLDQIIPGFQF